MLGRCDPKHEDKKEKKLFFASSYGWFFLIPAQTKPKITSSGHYKR